MLTVTRTYKDASSNTIRVDTITMLRTGSTLLDSVTKATYQRNLKTVVTYGTGISRTVNSITVETSADTIENVSGNFTYVQWTNFNGTNKHVYCNMSDLPAVGATV